MDIIEGFEAAIAVLIGKVTICEIYARIFIGVHQSPSESAELHSVLNSALPEFYAAVVVFVVKARSYFQDGGTDTYHFECQVYKICDEVMLIEPPSAMKKFILALKSFSTEFQPLIEEMNAKEEVISKCASIATMGRIEGMILRGVGYIVQILRQAYRDQRCSSEY